MYKKTIDDDINTLLDNMYLEDLVHLIDQKPIIVAESAISALDLLKVDYKNDVEEAVFNIVDSLLQDLQKRDYSLKSKTLIFYISKKILKEQRDIKDTMMNINPINYPYSSLN